MKNFIASLVNSGIANVANAVELRYERPFHRAPRFFEVGCEIHVPVDAPVLQTEVNFADGRTVLALFLPVEVVFADGDRQFDKLFLGMLTKAVHTADHTVVRTGGTVASLMDSCSTRLEQVQELLGSTFVVTDDVAVPDFRGHLHHVYDFDFINK